MSSPMTSFHAPLSGQLALLEPSGSKQVRRNEAEIKTPVGFWSSPAVIAPNNFVYKSLSSWAFNIAVGCSHACRFCYVLSAATIKQGPALAQYGVSDPDEQWGQYVLLRPWDEAKFLSSLNAAEKTPKHQLNRD